MPDPCCRKKTGHPRRTRRQAGNPMVFSIPRYIAIANPDSKRWRAYAADLSTFWRERGVEANIEVIPWRDVVPHLGRLDETILPNTPAIVRLESPGRNEEVTRLLLAAGAACTPGETVQDWQTAPMADCWCSSAA